MYSLIDVYVYHCLPVCQIWEAAPGGGAVPAATEEASLQGGGRWEREAGSACCKVRSKVTCLSLSAHINQIYHIRDINCYSFQNKNVNQWEIKKSPVGVLHPEGNNLEDEFLIPTIQLLLSVCACLPHNPAGRIKHVALIDRCCSAVKQVTFRRWRTESSSIKCH